MKKFIMFGDYCDDVEVKREPVRQAHLEHLRALKSRGVLEKAGPTRDLKKIFAIFIGESAEEIRLEIEQDVYWIHGIWTRYELSEWIDAI